MLDFYCERYKNRVCLGSCYSFCSFPSWSRLQRLALLFYNLYNTNYNLWLQYLWTWKCSFLPLLWPNRHMNSAQPHLEVQLYSVFLLWMQLDIFGVQPAVGTKSQRYLDLCCFKFVHSLSSCLLSSPIVYVRWDNKLPLLHEHGLVRLKAFAGHIYDISVGQPLRGTAAPLYICISVYVVSLLREIKKQGPKRKTNQVGLKTKSNLRTIKQKVGNKRAQKKGKDRKRTVKHDTQGHKLQNKTGND